MIYVSLLINSSHLSKHKAGFIIILLKILWRFGLGFQFREEQVSTKRRVTSIGMISLTMSNKFFKRLSDEFFFFDFGIRSARGLFFQLYGFENGLNAQFTQLYSKFLPHLYLLYSSSTMYVPAIFWGFF